MTLKATVSQLHPHSWSAQSGMFDFALVSEKKPVWLQPQPDVGKVYSVKGENMKKLNCLGYLKSLTMASAEDSGQDAQLCSAHFRKWWSGGQGLSNRSYLNVYWLNFRSTATVSRHCRSLGLHEQDWLRLVGQREARICVSVSLAIRILSIFQMVWMQLWRQNLTSDIKFWRRVSNLTFKVIAWCTGWLCYNMAFCWSLRFSSALWWKDLDPYSDDLGHIWLLLTNSL